jgi:hypothetical protein
MNESSAAVLDAPVTDDVDAAGGSDRKRLLMIVGAAAAAVVLGLVAWMLLSGSNSAEETGLVTPAPREQAAQPAPEEPVVEAAPETFDGELGRDPFEPLFEEVSEEAVADTDTGAVSPVVTDGSATGGTEVTGGTPVRVQMVDVTAAGATVTVDGASYDAVVGGDTFATVFRLYGVFDETCAGILFGDESVVMCEGDNRTLST